MGQEISEQNILFY